MIPRIHLEIDESVDADVRDELEACTAWLQREAGIRRPVTVRAMDCVGLDRQAGPLYAEPESGGMGLACILWPTETPDALPDGEAVEIRLAAGAASLFAAYGRPSAIATVIESLLHEFAHYEQWECCTMPDEDAAEARAAELYLSFNPDARRIEIEAE